MLIIKRPLVVFMAGFLALLVWIGLPFGVLGAGLQVTHINTLYLVLIFVVGRFFSGNFELYRIAKPLLLPALRLYAAIVFILLAGLLSSFNAQNLFEVIKFEISYLLGLTILIIFLGSLRDNDDIQFIANCLLAGAIITGIVTFLGFLVPAIGAITINQYGRAEGFLLHPNQWGMMLAAVIPLAGARLATNYRRLGYWFTIVVLTVSLALSGSKTNIFLAGIFGSAILIIASCLQPGLLQRSRSLFVTLVVVALAGLAAFALLQEFAPKVINNLRIILGDPTNYRTVVSRQEKWAEAIRLVQQAPFFGVGAGNTREYLDTNHAHNAFIDYYLTMGLFGVAALTVFLGAVINLCWHVFRISAIMTFNLRVQVIGFILGILSFILSNQFSNSFRGTPMPLMWVLLGLLIAQGNLWLKKH